MPKRCNVSRITFPISFIDILIYYERIIVLLVLGYNFGIQWLWETRDKRRYVSEFSSELTKNLEKSNNQNHHRKKITSREYTGS